MRLPRLVTPLLIWATASVLLSGCTSSPTTHATSSAPSSAGSSSATTSPSAPTTPGQGTATAAKPDAVTINITIMARQVSPSGTKINVTKGQTVILNVSSDMADEIHAHTAGAGYELEVKAGKPASGQFVASDTGSFEIESHKLNKIIAILNVR